MVIRIRIGRKRVLDKTGFAVRRITVKSALLSVSWQSYGFVAPRLASRVVDEFEYNGDADGFAKAYSEYIAKLKDIYKNADRGLKISLGFYMKKLDAESNIIFKVVNALKFASKADNVYKAYGRLLGAIGGPFIGLRVRPLVFMWGRSISLRYIDYDAAEKIGEMMNGYELIVYAPKSGGKLYCLDAYVYFDVYVNDIDNITCSRFVRTTISNPSDFESFVWGIIEAYSVEDDAINVLQDVMLHLKWIHDTGYSDDLVNDTNIALAKTYYELLSR